MCVSLISCTGDFLGHSRCQFVFGILEFILLHDTQKLHYRLAICIIIIYEINIFFFSLFSAPNTGLYLRFQQIWAMFVKKFYISLRSYGFLISQFFFPLFFIIFANVLVRSIPNNAGSEPKRALTLDNSALFMDNLSLFYAQLGNVSIDNTSEPFLLSVSHAV